MRGRVRAYLAECFGTNDGDKHRCGGNGGDGGTNVATMIDNAERAIMNYAIQYCTERGVAADWGDALFVDTYRIKAMSVGANLDPTSYVGNVGLREAIYSGRVRPQDLAFMSPDSLMPTRWEEVARDKQRRDHDAYEITYVPNASEIKCFKCKMNKVYFYEIQSRSADEPMTLVCTCLNCGNRWRMN